jgi:hypothetical protein
MNSKSSATECFVYITLPGQQSAVTAGRFVLTKNTRGDTLGRFVVDDMKAQVEATWYGATRASGVSETDAEIIRGAFVYPGFSL